MKRALYLLPSFLVMFFVVTSSALFAQANRATLSVQGVLTKSDGTAVDDGNDYVLTFRLWKDENSTNINDRVHIETIEDITIVGGVYSVVLGLDDNEKLLAPFDQNYWLGVSVGTSNVELLPRPRLTHAPYALGLVGQNNTFPSTGNVVADGFSAKGGAGAIGHGYSFQSATGDSDGGMFSNGDNNVHFYANNTEKIKISNTLNELFGKTNTNELEVFGNEKVNGSSTITQHQTIQGTQTVNGFFKVNNNQEITGFSTIGANQTINGTSLTKQFVRTYGANDGGGFTFNYPNNIDDTDSGLFGGGDGVVQIRANNTVVAQFTPAQGYTNQCCNTPSSVKFFGIQKGPDQPQVEWDEVSGQLQVDNSSRRLKRNIQPLTDNYRLILQAQPRLYNRIGYPDALVELGYIAEEFDSIGLTRLVHYNSKDEIIGVNYKKVSIYLTEVVKDHEVAIASMQAEIDALKKQNAQLKQSNQSLQTSNTTLQQEQSAFSAQLEALSKRLSALEMSGTGK